MDNDNVLGFGFGFGFGMEVPRFSGNLWIMWAAQLITVLWLL